MYHEDQHQRVHQHPPYMPSYSTTILPRYKPHWNREGYNRFNEDGIRIDHYGYQERAPRYYKPPLLRHPGYRSQFQNWDRGSSVNRFEPGHLNYSNGHRNRFPRNIQNQERFVPTRTIENRTKNDRDSSVKGSKISTLARSFSSCSEVNSNVIFVNTNREIPKRVVSMKKNPANSEKLPPTDSQKLPPTDSQKSPPTNSVKSPPTKSVKSPATKSVKSPIKMDNDKPNRVPRVNGAKKLVEVHLNTPVNIASEESIANKQNCSGSVGTSEEVASKSIEQQDYPSPSKCVNSVSLDASVVKSVKTCSVTDSDIIIIDADCEKISVEAFSSTPVASQLEPPTNSESLKTSSVTDSDVIIIDADCEIISVKAFSKTPVASPLELISNDVFSATRVAPELVDITDNAFPGASELENIPDGDSAEKPVSPCLVIPDASFSNPPSVSSEPLYLSSSSEDEDDDVSSRMEIDNEEIKPIQLKDKLVKPGTNFNGDECQVQQDRIHKNNLVENYKTTRRNLRDKCFSDLPSDVSSLYVKDSEANLEDNYSPVTSFDMKSELYSHISTVTSYDSDSSSSSDSDSDLEIVYSSLPCKKLHVFFGKFGKSKLKFCNAYSHVPFRAFERTFTRSTVELPLTGKSVWLLRQLVLFPSSFHPNLERKFLIPTWEYKKQQKEEVRVSEFLRKSFSLNFLLTLKSTARVKEDNKHGCEIISTAPITQATIKRLLKNKTIISLIDKLPKALLQGLRSQFSAARPPSNKDICTDVQCFPIESVIMTSKQLVSQNAHCNEYSLKPLTLTTKPTARNLQSTGIANATTLNIIPFEKTLSSEHCSNVSKSYAQSPMKKVSCVKSLKASNIDAQSPLKKVSSVESSKASNIDAQRPRKRVSFVEPLEPCDMVGNILKESILSDNVIHNSFVRNSVPVTVHNDNPKPTPSLMLKGNSFKKGSTSPADETSKKARISTVQSNIQKPTTVPRIQADESPGKKQTNPGTLQITPPSQGQVGRQHPRKNISLEPQLIVPKGNPMNRPGSGKQYSPRPVNIGSMQPTCASKPVTAQQTKTLKRRSTSSESLPGIVNSNIASISIPKKPKFSEKSDRDTAQQQCLPAGEQSNVSDRLKARRKIFLSNPDESPQASSQKVPSLNAAKSVKRRSANTEKKNTVPNKKTKIGNSRKTNSKNDNTNLVTQIDGTPRKCRRTSVSAYRKDPLSIEIDQNFDEFGSVGLTLDIPEELQSTWIVDMPLTTYSSVSTTGAHSKIPSIISKNSNTQLHRNDIESVDPRSLVCVEESESSNLFVIESCYSLCNSESVNEAVFTSTTCSEPVKQGEHTENLSLPTEFSSIPVQSIIEKTICATLNSQPLPIARGQEKPVFHSTNSVLAVKNVVREQQTLLNSSNLPAPTTASGQKDTEQAMWNGQFPSTSSIAATSATTTAETDPVKKVQSDPLHSKNLLEFGQTTTAHKLLEDFFCNLANNPETKDLSTSQIMDKLNRNLALLMSTSHSETIPETTRSPTISPIPNQISNCSSGLAQDAHHLHPSKQSQPKDHHNKQSEPTLPAPSSKTAFEQQQLKRYQQIQPRELKENARDLGIGDRAVPSLNPTKISSLNSSITTSELNHVPQQRTAPNQFLETPRHEGSPLVHYGQLQNNGLSQNLQIHHQQNSQELSHNQNMTQQWTLSRSIQNTLAQDKRQPATCVSTESRVSPNDHSKNLQPPTSQHRQAPELCNLIQRTSSHPVAQTPERRQNQLHQSGSQQLHKLDQNVHQPQQNARRQFHHMRQSVANQLPIQSVANHLPIQSVPHQSNQSLRNNNHRPNPGVPHQLHQANQSVPPEINPGVPQHLHQPNKSVPQQFSHTPQQFYQPLQNASQELHQISSKFFASNNSVQSYQKFSTSQPRPSIVQHHPSIAQPHPSIAQPRPSIAPPRPSIAPPRSSNGQPRSSHAQPQGSHAQPQGSHAHPQTSTAHPQSSPRVFHSAHIEALTAIVESRQHYSRSMTETSTATYSRTTLLQHPPLAYPPLPPAAASSATVPAPVPAPPFVVSRPRGPSTPMPSWHKPQQLQQEEFQSSAVEYFEVTRRRLSEYPQQTQNDNREPFLTAPPPCDFDCGNAATLMCKGCRLANYCSLECRNSDWLAIHYKHCRRLDLDQRP